MKKFAPLQLETHRFWCLLPKTRSSHRTSAKSSWSTVKAMGDDAQERLPATGCGRHDRSPLRARAVGVFRTNLAKLGVGCTPKLKKRLRKLSKRTKLCEHLPIFSTFQKNQNCHNSPKYLMRIDVKTIHQKCTESIFTGGSMGPKSQFRSSIIHTWVPVLCHHACSNEVLDLCILRSRHFSS